MLRLAAALSLIAASTVIAPLTVRDQPPLRLAIEVGGKSYDANAGEPIEVELDGKKTTLTVSVKPTRRFAAAGVAFDYPNDLRYEFDDSDNLSMWTLDGDACLLMVQQLLDGSADELTPMVLAEILGDQDGATAPEKVEVQLGKQKVAALRAKVVRESYTETWTAIGIDANNRPIILLLQEVVDEEGASAAERQRILDLLGATFAILQ